MRHGWLALLIAALGVSLPLAAQDEAPADADAPPAASPGAEAPPADTSPDEDRAEGQEPRGASDARRAAAETEDDFVPTEEVPPDEEVVFPVNF
jgi:hypothetical protein